VNPLVDIDRLRRALLLGLASIATMAGAPRSLAQAILPDRLFPVSGHAIRPESRRAFLGIWSEGELARLTVFDDTLAQRSSSASFGLAPLDVVWQPVLRRALLLAAPARTPAIFSVPMAAEPVPELIWRGEGAAFRRIVTTGDFDRNGVEDVAIVGDSAFAIVSLDGRLRATLAGAILEAYPVTVSATQFAVVSRDGSNVTVSLYDVARARILDRVSLPLDGPLISHYRPDESTLLSLGSARAGSDVYTIDLANRLERVQYPITDRRGIARPATALVAYELEGRSIAAALVDTKTAPLLAPLAPHAESVAIDYPLSMALVAVASSPRFTALIAADSTAIYSRRWELLGTVRSPGVEAPRLVELGGDTLLLATASGSMRFAIPRDTTPWIARNWPLVLAALALALLVGAVVAMISRYSLVQSIYFNLVGVPSSYGVIVLSRTQRVTQMNGSARELLGISSYIPLGRHVGEYFTRDELRGVVGALRTLFAEGEPFEQRLDLDTGAGPRALNFRARSMLTRSGFRAGYLILVEDVTRTIAQERLVNWASVAHHIAHEMKTPLGTVRMTAEMLRDRLSSNGRDEEYLRATTRILRQSERLRDIVDDLLTVARTESLQKTRADLALLVSSLVNDYSEYLPGNIALGVSIVGDDLRCTIDVQQVSVALRNLLDNARHAIGSRDDGRISVSVTTGAQDVVIVVEDNGVGMRPETLAHLFQPFYTEREGGSGIGTVIIKRVFEAHGGTVEVTSSPGVGTRFVVTLPRDA
jgi:signal transduction histidine kinase